MCLDKLRKVDCGGAKASKNERGIDIVALLLVVVALGVIAWCLLTYEDNMLWKMQELNLHMDTWLFFKQQMVVAGGLLTWLGTFFTEFFYHPWQGVLMICVWWALLMWLSAKALHVEMKWAVLMLVPVSLLLASNMELGYWIYFMKLRGYFFVGTIGLTLAMACVWGYRSLPAVLRPWAVIVAGAVLYPLIGAYGLLAVVLMGLSMVCDVKREDGRRSMVVCCILALLTVWLVPIIYYWTVYYQTNYDDIYLAALPVFELDKAYPQYYVPFILLGVFYVVMALWSENNRQRISHLFTSSPFHLFASVALLAMIGWGVHHFWYRDYNFEKELEMRRAMEQSDWERMLRAAANLKEEPTRAIVMMKNLALFRLGRQGNDMYHYRTGSKMPNAPMPVKITQVVGSAIYYAYGQANYCYRWCLEDGVEYGWRAEYLKYMTRCALVNGEMEVAKKYIRLLKHTRFHKEWAEAQEQYVNHPETIKDNKDYAIVKRLLMMEDHLGSDNAQTEMYLMNVLLDINSTDPLVQELTLLSALWKKDIGLFWPRFFNYAALHKGEHMPKHYQEAAYLYGNLEHQVDISKMPFDEDVVRSYKDFMELAQRCSGMTEEQMQPVFYPQFGKTFYYEYFLIRNQKSN